MEEGCGVTCVEVEVGCGFTGVSCGGTRGGGDGDLDICLPEMGRQEDNSKLYMHQQIWPCAPYLIFRTTPAIRFDLRRCCRLSVRVLESLWRSRGRQVFSCGHADET